MTAMCAFADPSLARTRLRVAALDQWAEIGLALATRVAAEARRDFAEASRLLMRIAQAVRLATLLAMRLCQPDNPAFQPVPAKARAPRAAGSEAAAERVQARDRPREKPQRQGWIGSRDRELPDDAILRRPLKDIVRLICRTLGVTPDWSLWSDEDAPAGSAAAPQPERPMPVVVPPPDPVRAIPKPPPRPALILDRPTRPPPARRRRTRLMTSCATGALIPAFPPIVPWRADAAACPTATAPPFRSAGVPPAPSRATAPTAV